MQIFSCIEMYQMYLLYSEDREVKCGTLIAFIKTIGVYSHHEAHQIIIP